MSSFDPIPLDAYAWKTLNADIGHQDGPFALPGAPNPLNWPVLSPLDLEFQWAPDHMLCSLWHLHGFFGNHVDPAPGPPLTESPCGHGGLIHLLGAGGFVPAGNAELFCPITTYDGGFQPTQDVWQDDPVFADAPGKRITQPDPVAPAYVAELDMVKNRDAYPVGTERPVGGANMPGARDVIYLRGQSTGAGLVPVRIRFTRREGGQVTWTHDDPTVHQLPFGKPCAPTPVPFNAEIAAGAGIPAAGSPFKFTRVGGYELEAELVLMDGTPIGLKATVGGETVENNGVKALLVPLVFSSETDTQAIRDELHATAMTSQAKDQLPDWYPIEMGDFSTDVTGTDIAIISEDYLNESSKGMKEPFRSQWRATLRRRQRRPLQRQRHHRGQRGDLLAGKHLELRAPAGPGPVTRASGARVEEAAFSAHAQDATGHLCGCGAAGSRLFLLRSRSLSVKIAAWRQVCEGNRAGPCCGPSADS